MEPCNVLVVDDEVSILKAIERLLRKENCRVWTATGGAAALAILEAEDIRLVVSDKNMPGMNGLDFLKQVKRDHPKVLTIMLTGNADLASAVDAINEAGVFKYIQKPWDNDGFLFTIREALGYLASRHGTDGDADGAKANDIVLRDLEKEYPGISKIKRDKEGYIIG